MTAPKRIQRKRTKGWRKPEGAIVVSRPSKWGNPFVGDSDRADREYVTALFAAWMNRPEKADFVAEVQRELRGQDLACWCPLDQPCHGDVLLEIANNEKPDLRRFMVY